jgi:ribosomal protein L11
MTLNQANSVNAKTSTFEYVQVPFTVSAMNDREFALAA